MVKMGNKSAKDGSHLDLMQAIHIDLQPSAEATPTRNTAFQHNAEVAQQHHPVQTTPCHTRHGQVAQNKLKLEIDRHGNHPKAYLLKVHGLTSGSAPQILCAMYGVPRSQ